MSSSKVKGEKNKIKYNLWGMLIIIGVSCILLGYFIIQSQGLEKKIEVYNKSIETLDQSIEAEKERAQEIEELKAYMETDEYVEKIAREKLGLVKENEIVFKEKR